MRIVLYNNKSENKKVDKELETIKTMDGSLRDECSVEDPSVLIEASAEEIGRTNYFYIDSFDRYYFLTDAVSVRNGLWRISGHSDVLSNNKEEIRALNGLVSRSEDGNYYLVDSERVMYANPHVVYKKFSGSLPANNDSIILITV